MQFLVYVVTNDSDIQGNLLKFVDIFKLDFKMKYTIEWKHYSIGI